MSVGDRIKSIRKGKMTQKELAEKTGLAEITIRQYEAGKYEPKHNNLQKIADALGVDCSDLVENRYEERSEFGKRLEYFRTKAGLNKSELARKMGVTPAMVRQYENGPKNPKYETIKRFADGLDVEPECLEPFRAESKWVQCDIQPNESKVIATVRRTINDAYIDHVVMLDVSYRWSDGQAVFSYEGKLLNEKDGFKVLAWMPLPQPYKEKTL